MFDICEVPRLGKLETNTTSWGVFAMGLRIPGQGRLQKPGGKHTPELAEGERTPSQFENTLNNIITQVEVDRERGREVYTSDIVVRKITGSCPLVKTKIHRLQCKYKIIFHEIVCFSMFCFVLLFIGI